MFRLFWAYFLQIFLIWFCDHHDGRRFEQWLGFWRPVIFEKESQDAEETIKVTFLCRVYTGDLSDRFNPIGLSHFA